MSAFAFVISGAAIAGSDEQAGNDVKLVTISDLDIGKQAQQTLAEGRQVFRFDTFGDQAFWGDTIKLHQAIEGARFGGVGPAKLVTLQVGAGQEAALPVPQ